MSCIIRNVTIYIDYPVPVAKAPVSKVIVPPFDFVGLIISQAKKDKKNILALSKEKSWILFSENITDNSKIRALVLPRHKFALLRLKLIEVRFCRVAAL
jgi:hypothetical protein